MSRPLTAQPSLPLFGRTATRAVKNLGILPGDGAAFATGINNRGQVVGSTFNSVGWSRGFIWQDDVMTDLNTLIPEDSNLFIIAASNINERGQISGMATVMSGPDEGKIHAILLTPVDETHRRLDCRFRTYTPAFHFARECLHHSSQRFGPGPFGR